MSVGRDVMKTRRGFTLLEMLVTLVVVSLVAAILGQAMFQLSRVEQLLAGTQLNGLTQSVRMAWVRALIDGTLPGQPNTAERFKGTERRISGFSVEVPAFPENTAERYELSLQTAPDGSRTRLVLTRPLAGGAATETTLLDWAGSMGRFGFLAADERWVSQWPPEQALPPGLPAAVSLETGLDSHRVLIAAPRARAEPLLTRRNVDQL